MHFHHGDAAFISGKRMFMLAVPKTTFFFYPISTDGNFQKRDVERGLQQKDDKTAHIKRREMTTYFEESSR